MILLALWSGANIFEASATTVRLKVFFSQIEYLFASFVPLQFLGFAFFYTGRSQWLNSRFYRYAYVIPITLIVLVFTNKYHLFIWTGFSDISSYNLIEYQHGIGFYIFWVGHAYVCLGIITLMFIEFIVTHQRIFIRQGILLLLALLFPWIASLFYLLEINLIPGLNLTPASFIFSGIFFLFSILYSSFIDLVPIAIKQVIEGLNDGIIVIDHRNRLIYHNLSAQLYFLKGDKPVIGKSLEMIPFHTIELKSHLLTLEPGHKPVDFFDGENSKYWEIQCLGIEKFPACRLFIFRDITQQKLAQEKIYIMNEELRQLNAQKDRLFSIIGHDLRNFFAVILGHCELLQMELEEENYESMATSTRNIVEAAERALNLLENLLMWARAEGENLILNIELINLKTVIDNVLAEMIPRAMQKQISLEAEIDSTLEVESDENMLMIIFRNLISNSIKFTPRGGSIRVFANNADEQSVRLVVQDSGIGIPQAMLENIFRIDSTTGRSGTENEKSTGFGLILVKELVGLLGGKIFIESEEGKGTRGNVILPKKHQGKREKSL